MTFSDTCNNPALINPGHEFTKTKKLKNRQKIRVVIIYYFIQNSYIDTWNGYKILNIKNIFDSKFYKNVFVHQ